MNCCGAILTIGELLFECSREAGHPGEHWCTKADFLPAAVASGKRTQLQRIEWRGDDREDCPGCGRPFLLTKVCSYCRRTGCPNCIHTYEVIEDFVPKEYPLGADVDVCHSCFRERPEVFGGMVWEP